MYPLRPTARTRASCSEEASIPAMAKRARGSVRPGQRRPIDRRPASPAGPASPGPARVEPRPSGLSEAELARAAELEAQLLAEERAAEEARRRTRERSAVREVGAGGALSVRAEEEYAYVARDVKRITRVAALLLGTLLLLWILIDGVGVLPVG